MNLEVRQTLAQLWLRMSEIYGAQFANQYGAVGGEAFQTWCLGLRDLSPTMIKKGFARLLERKKAFVPNLNEFKSLCEPSPEELGLLSLESAYREAAEKCRRPSRYAWSHPVVYHAGKTVGWYDLSSKPRSSTFPLFKSVYTSLCKRVMKGEAFDLPKPDPTRLEQHRNGRKATTEQCKIAGRNALDQMKKSVGLLS